MKKVVLIALLWAGFCLNAQSISHEIVPTRARVGDRVMYHLRVPVQAAVALEMLPTLGNQWGDFKVLSTTLNRSLDSGVSVWNFKAELFPVETGRAVFPTVSVGLRTSKGVKSYPVSALTLDIDAIYPAGAMMKPSTAPEALSFSWGVWALKWIGILLGIMALVSVGIVLWRRAKGYTKKKVVVELSPRAWVLSALAALESERLREKGESQLYYFRLTEIIKTFLTKVTDEPLEECTTEETLSCLHGIFEDVTFKRTQHVLMMADLAKFAKIIPTDTEHQEMIRRLHAIIGKVST